MRLEGFQKAQLSVSVPASFNGICHGIPIGLRLSRQDQSVTSFRTRIVYQPSRFSASPSPVLTRADFLRSTSGRMVVVACEKKRLEQDLAAHGSRLVGEDFARRVRRLISSVLRPVALATASCLSSAETNVVHSATCAAAI
jgi:hypothetical protein